MITQKQKEVLTEAFPNGFEKTARLRRELDTSTNKNLK